EIAGATLARAGGDGWTALLARWAESESQRGGAPPLLDVALPEFERALIRVALAHTGGHRQDAAKLLGWGRNTLTRKLKELGMEDGDVDDAQSDAAA
ncbi:MAG: helix-turn-helix domain-containing protein, partial [Gammaproteobacteria bacterium]